MNREVFQKAGLVGVFEELKVIGPFENVLLVLQSVFDGAHDVEAARKNHHIELSHLPVLSEIQLR